VDTLPISEDDALALARLPRFHPDPFDRMPVGQTIANQAAIVTPDPLIARHPVSVQWRANAMAPEPSPTSAAPTSALGTAPKSAHLMGPKPSGPVPGDHHPNGA